MRILLTGAAGFIGSHLVDRFLAEGHEVVGVDNFLTGRVCNLAHLTGAKGFGFLERDVCEPLAVDGPVDWVLHFASPASPPKYLAFPLETMRVNTEGTRHLLELAKRKNAQFFLASTSEVYGDPVLHPQPEKYRGNVNPIGPRSVCDEAKRMAETLTMAYQRHFGVRSRIIRIFNTYGPRMDPNDGRVVTNFITQALAGESITLYGNGTQTRSFQYVDDLIEGIRRLMDIEYFQPVNLGNPEEFTMRELALLIRQMTGSRSLLVNRPLPEDDPCQRRPDNSLAESLLKWKPAVPVAEGLVRTIQYLRDHRSDEVLPLSPSMLQPVSYARYGSPDSELTAGAVPTRSEQLRLSI